MLRPTMMQPVVLALAVALASSVVSARQCQELTIPVSITARNAVFDVEPMTTEIDVADFFLELSRQGTNYTDTVLSDYATISGDYHLAATYCTPDSGPGEVLQILTHGIGFDRTYWDPALDARYSYVDAAVDGYGYSTLAWDRLGVGASSHGEPVNEIQIALEVAALAALTASLVHCVSSCAVSHSYSRVVHVGHSFGASMTYGLVAANPAASDAVVLTGFSQVPDYVGLFALGGHFAPVAALPALSARYGPGYVAPGDRSGVHANFFAPGGDFDPAVLDYAHATAQAATPGEILTVISGTDQPSPFAGPSLVVTGERDLPFCGGDCYATSAINGTAPDLVSASARYFPRASPFSAVVVPGAGHGLNLGYSAEESFDVILEFLEEHL